MMEVRRAAETDALGISRVHATTWQQAYAGLMPTEFLAGQTVEGRLEKWTRILHTDAESQATTWVAVDDGVIVGFVSAGPSRDEPTVPTSWEVYAVYVVPEHWGRGVGEPLLSRAIRSAPAEAERVHLWVLADNQRAINFYKKHGFAHDGSEEYRDIGGARILEQRYSLTLAHMV